MDSLVYPLDSEEDWNPRIATHPLLQTTANRASVVLVPLLGHVPSLTLDRPPETGLIIEAITLAARKLSDNCSVLFEDIWAQAEAQGDMFVSHFDRDTSDIGLHATKSAVTGLETALSQWDPREELPASHQSAVKSAIYQTACAVKTRVTDSLKSETDDERGPNVCVVTRKEWDSLIRGHAGEPCTISFAKSFKTVRTARPGHSSLVYKALHEKGPRSKPEHLRVFWLQPDGTILALGGSIAPSSKGRSHALSEEGNGASGSEEGNESDALLRQYFPA